MADLEEPIDPFEAHTKREPLRSAGARVLALSSGDPIGAQKAAESVVRILSGFGRQAEIRVVEVDGNWASAIEQGLDGTKHPLVFITTAKDAWTRAHVEPLLKSIDKCDHVVGLRPTSILGRIGRRLGAFGRRGIFGVPVRDVHSPCRLHRLEKLEAIPLQSRSAFLNTEILAKATFLGHLIDEVAVPALPAADKARVAWSDILSVFRDPTFVRGSRPAEDLQGNQEAHDRPGGEDGDRAGHVHPARALEDDSPERTDELSQRQSLDQRLRGGGEALRGEEDSGEEPHRQHDQVHQTADGLRGLGPAADQQADPGERQCAEHVDHHDQ
jgi:hypothetical protein